jgi:UDP-N-acetylmuramoyl-L-alanyl-D-glutamate--2,6-diaminopimelate ligase
VHGRLIAMGATISAAVTAVPTALVRRVVGDVEVVVDDVQDDSRQVTPGALFACLVGDHADGHRFAADAVEAGAAALLVEHPLDVPVPQLVVSDSRAAVGYVAAAVHGHPARSMRMVGVTGTNGKTTTTQLLSAILESAALRTGVIGTLSGARTTPEASELQRRLAAMRDSGVAAVAMEVSSHALALDRVNGCHFEVGVFTNLGRDHLDLHGSMEEYFRAKSRLFTTGLVDAAVVNVDDQHGRLLLDTVALADDRPRTAAFSAADATDVVVGTTRSTFRWRDRDVVVPLGGDVNVLNALAALTVAEVMGLDLDVAIAALAGAPPVPGRFEVVVDEACTVVVDYAHTPDGLSELLRSARRTAGGGRVVVVFGCGGDRDREKRPEMGAVAAGSADVVVVTSDNPRHEPPLEIIDEIVAGVPADRRGVVVVDEDRARAIQHAISIAEPGDIVVVAGKGHEATQTIGDVAHPFDDREVVRSIWQGREARA